MSNATINAEIKNAVKGWAPFGVLPMEPQVISLDPAGIPIPARDRRYGVEVTFARHGGEFPLFIGEFDNRKECDREVRRISRLLDKYSRELFPA